MASFMKIVFGYTGGLEATVALAWLRETFQAEIIAVCADLGQGDELRGLEKRATKAGAAKVLIEDLQEEFARDFVFPLTQAGAIRGDQYFLGTSIATSLVVKRMVEIARQHQVSHLAHAATGKGNDQVRFELTAAALAPELPVIALWRDGSFRAQFPRRAEMIRFCEERKIPLPASAKHLFTINRNILQASFASGGLDDPWSDSSAPEHKDLFKLSVAPEEAPDKAEQITLEFEKGVCVAVNGRPMSPLAVLRALNRHGGKHGIGRIDLVENREADTKSRGVYETPAGAILQFGHLQLESLTLDRDARRLQDSLIPKYSELVHQGNWFSPEREALQSVVTELQKKVTGTIRLKLYKGSISNAGRKSPQSLFTARTDAAASDSTPSYNQAESTELVRLNSLRLKVASHLENAKQE